MCVVTLIWGVVFMYLGRRFEQDTYSADGGFWEAGLDHNGIHELN